jgi:hypothetical protein
VCSFAGGGGYIDRGGVGGGAGLCLSMHMAQYKRKKEKYYFPHFLFGKIVRPRCSVLHVNILIKRYCFYEREREPPRGGNM